MASYSIRAGPLYSTRRRKHPSLMAIEASLSAGLNGSHGGSALAPAPVTGSEHSMISEVGIGSPTGTGADLGFGGLFESSRFFGGDRVDNDGWFFLVRGVCYES
ncbi:hypothetical protein SLA2020_418050 [Shorea laevis]